VGSSARGTLGVMPTPGATTPVELVDSFGRVHRDLRISITDRCDLRCTYCMPAEGLAWLPRSDVLSYEEIARLARLFVERFGFGSIRLTGGEPLVRAHPPVLVAALAALPVDLSLTTNGVTLARHAEPLARAGLRRVNVSLDTLRPDRFLAITRRDALADVLAGIDAALAAGLAPVKVNMVVMRGVNDDEIVDVARFGRERGVVVRFIEFMPLDADGTWDRGAVVSRQEVLARLGEAFPLEPVGRGEHGSEPAERFAYRDGAGEVGIIPTVTDAFCDSCDRVRLTAEGKLRACLFALEETDLRGPMRAGATDDELAELVVGAVAGKWAGHGIEQVQFLRPARSMSQIGG
jgi:cyclic pyranopterin phosphate synthase